MSEQPALFPMPVVGVFPASVLEANLLIERFGHYLGAVHRPFRQEAWIMRLDDDRPIAVAVSASIVNGPVGAGWTDKAGEHFPFEDRPQGFARSEVVELARLAACERWAARAMLRLWRECCAPRWAGWPVRAAVAYSQNARHDGSLYRWDGWTKVKDDAGSSGGGTWGRKRTNADTVYGKKTLWVWRYEAMS